MIDMTTDKHLQESAEDVLERSMNFAPDGEWIERENRMRRVLTFMEQRHLLALARQHNEHELAQEITKKNRFFIRLTNR